MTRVLHVLPTRQPSYGGPVRVAEAFARHLPSHGFDAELFPADVRPSGPAFWPGFRGLAALRRAVVASDLVHVHGLWTFPSSAAAAAARAAGKPYVITPHGMLDRWSLSRSRRKKQLWALAVERANLNRANALHFFNAEERSEAADFGLTARSFLLPNGVDIRELSALPGREALRRWGVAEDERVLLFLGRIHPKKGFDVLIPALGKLAPPFRLLIAGPDEGSYRADVEAAVAREGLGSSVTFVGEVRGEDKRALLGGADVFVLPSHQEGDSIAVKEALAAGVPVLISDKCHFPEVQSEGAGLVVPDAVDAVAAALQTLAAESSSQRSTRQQKARALAAKYDWAKLSARLAEQYRTLLR